MYAKSGRKVRVRAVSIGGGSISIIGINDIVVSMDGAVPNLLILHQDTPGMIAKVASILSDLDINIATMKVDRVAKGGAASMIIELDQDGLSTSVDRIKNLDGVAEIIYIPKQTGGSRHD